MALQRNYNVPNTSLIISGAYHMVTDIDIQKRNMDDLGPVSGTVSGSNQIDFELDRTSDPVYWKTGYTCKVMVDVYASKEARDTSKKPIATLGRYAIKLEENLATNGMDEKIMFYSDTNDTENILTQAYNHLKSTDYYKNAIDI
jgi:hypothetical protein